MRYYISDLHFYHDDLNTRMDCRGFENVQAMNEHMIQMWNQKVKPGDEVVILGDFSLGGAKQTNEILHQLNGTLYLIEGNHDRYVSSNSFDKKRFVWIRPYAEMRDDKRKVILSHYPIFCYNDQYRLSENGSPFAYMLYGHVHNTYDEWLVHNFQKQTRSHTREVYGREQPMAIPCHMINCFCMFSRYEPLSLDEWIALDNGRREELDNNGKNGWQSV